MCEYVILQQCLRLRKSTEWECVEKTLKTNVCVLFFSCNLGGTESNLTIQFWSYQCFKIFVDNCNTFQSMMIIKVYKYKINYQMGIMIYISDDQIRPLHEGNGHEGNTAKPLPPDASWLPTSISVPLIVIGCISVVMLMIFPVKTLIITRMNTRNTNNNNTGLS